MHICHRDKCHTNPLDILIHGQEVILEKLEKIMTAQENLDNDVASLQATTTQLVAIGQDLLTAAEAIQAELAALPTEVDTTGVDSAVADLANALAPLQAAQAAIDADVTPTAPAS
jgi:hypothetical protein